MKLKNLNILVVFTFFLFACEEKKVNPSEQLQVIKDALQEEGFVNLVVPISAAPSNSITDLQPLKSLLTDKQIVGIGEATHGTAEFQTIKHRYVQFLVTELAFRALAIEENFSVVVPVNEYVQTGIGNVDDLLNGLRSNIFKTQEFKALVEWMRNYNEGKSEADKILLYGMDAQNVGYSAIAIQAFIEAYDNSYLTDFNATASSFLVDFTDFSSEQEFIAALPALSSKIQQVRAHVQNNDVAYTASAGSKGYILLLQHIRIIEQALAQNNGFVESIDAGFEVRDENMAENIQWIENNEGAGSKIMVWAHNGHITLNKQKYFSDRAINVLGTNLRSIYGNGYYSIGFVFNEGEFYAVNRNGENQKFTVKPYKTSHLPKALASLPHPVFFYAFESHATNPSLTKLFNKEYDFYLLGAGYEGKEEDVIVSVNLTKEFDGIIFVSKTTALNPL